MQSCLIAFIYIIGPLAIIDGFGVVPVRVASIPYGWIYGIYVLAITCVLAWSVAFRNVVHIVNDVIIHFTSPDSNSFFFRSGVNATSYPIRRRIARRFRSVLRLFLRDNPTHLLVIAHSQGTIIAIEELRQQRWEAAFRTLKSVTLLTFGSPLTHLYQEYFPLHYRK